MTAFNLYSLMEEGADSFHLPCHSYSETITGYFGMSCAHTQVAHSVKVASLHSLKQRNVSVNCPVCFVCSPQRSDKVLPSAAGG